MYVREEKLVWFCMFIRLEAELLPSGKPLPLPFAALNITAF
jgi:hypothetical protein